MSIMSVLSLHSFPQSLEIFIFRSCQLC